MALVTAKVAMSGGDYQPKGYPTPHVKVTKIKFSDQPMSTESYSFFYKRLMNPAIVESKYQMVEAESFALTALALKNLEDGQPIKTHSGQANIIKVSSKEYIIVAVIADDVDATFCANNITGEINRLR
jgi:hypothetical protein